MSCCVVRFGLWISSLPPPRTLHESRCLARADVIREGRQDLLFPLFQRHPNSSSTRLLNSSTPLLSCTSSLTKEDNDDDEDDDIELSAPLVRCLLPTAIARNACTVGIGDKLIGLHRSASSRFQSFLLPPAANFTTKYLVTSEPRSDICPRLHGG